MSARDTVACAQADVERMRAIRERPDDEYEGLPSTFAAACRAADERQRRKPVDPAIERLRRLLDDEISLDQDYREIMAHRARASRR
jgi:hypothetical protein